MRLKICKTRKSYISLVLAVLLCVSLLAGCQSSGTQATATTTKAATSTTTTTTTAKSGTTANNTSVTGTTGTTASSIEYKTKDLNATWPAVTATITLNGSSINVSGTGATAEGSKLMITAAGTYVLSGKLTDGQIRVNSTDEDPVRLVLNGVDITCSNSAPIYVLDAKKVVLILADGKDNKITDGSTYILEDTTNNEPNAAIFSKSDLTINGTGSLTVNGNYNHGINCKEELKIISGTITVNAVSDGIKGRDFVAIKGGTVNITAKTDGIQATNDEDATLGLVVIDGGTITVNSTEDGIQAETNVLVNGGTLNITAGGGSGNTVSSNTATQGRGTMPGGNTTKTTTTATSTKGIKATLDVIINSGTITVSSADDTVHSGQNITINGGTLTLASGDDGIHADTGIVINNGDINITKSYEGIESANIDVTGGTIHLIASDDGFNVAGGADSSAVNGRPGQNGFAALANSSLDITGGYISVDAGGDGLDSNGSMTMTGGTAIVNGPTNNGNGPLDYNGTFKMTGGTLVAVGSSGMAQAPDTSSTQYAILINLSSSLPANTMIHIEDASGNDILTMTPSKTYQSVMLCSPNLKNGETYTIYTGGSSTGTVKDTLVSGGSYKSGSKYGTVKIAGIITTSGSGGQMNPGRK